MTFGKLKFGRIMHSTFLIWHPPWHQPLWTDFCIFNPRCSAARRVSVIPHSSHIIRYCTSCWFYRSRYRLDVIQSGNTKVRSVNPPGDINLHEVSSWFWHCGVGLCLSGRVAATVAWDHWGGAGEEQWAVPLIPAARPPHAPTNQCAPNIFFVVELFVLFRKFSPLSKSLLKLLVGTHIRSALIFRKSRIFHT